jgi:hypothetical protein
MKVKVKPLDLMSLCGVWILSQKGFAFSLPASEWWLLWAPVVVVSWFINPRWDKQKGWRFKHGD